MKSNHKDNLIDYNALIDTINGYLAFHNSDIKSENIDESYRITVNCVNSFAKIFEECLSFGNFKDTWEYTKFYQNIYGPELIIKALKTKSDYRLGLNEKGLYISTHLSHTENLRYMGDNYWKLLLRLSDFNGFEYDEYEFVRDERTKEFPELFKTNKSMIYRIMRKYFFDQTETNFQYFTSSVGEFKIVGKLDVDLPETIKKFCEAFKIMYKLNYDLWKMTDLKIKKVHD